MSTWEWLTSYVKIFFQGKGFLPFSDSKNGNTAPLSLICLISICDLLGFLAFFIPGGLPLGLNFGLYFLFFRFLFLNLSKIAFKVRGFGSREESLDESVSTLAGEITHFVGFLSLCVGEGTYCVLNKLSDESSLKKQINKLHYWIITKNNSHSWVARQLTIITNSHFLELHTHPLQRTHDTAAKHSHIGQIRENVKNSNVPFFQSQPSPIIPNTLEWSKYQLVWHTRPPCPGHHI